MYAFAFAVGFHGCDKEIGEKVLSRRLYCASVAIRDQGNRRFNRPQRGELDCRKPETPEN